MNFAAFAAVASAILAIYVAVLTRRISSAPGSRDQRGFWIVALSSAAYATCDFLAMVYSAPWIIVALSRVQTLAAIVQLWGWVRYSHAFTAEPSSEVERLARAAMFVAGASVLV